MQEGEKKESERCKRVRRRKRVRGAKSEKKKESERCKRVRRRKRERGARG